MGVEIAKQAETVIVVVEVIATTPTFWAATVAIVVTVTIEGACTYAAGM